MNNNYINNSFYYLNSTNVFFSFTITIALFCILLLTISYIVSTSNPYYEKHSSYECGFDPFADSREPFYIKFYLISILFIIFDVEVIYFFPWGFSITQILLPGYLAMYPFILILTLGFYYEWCKGTLDWS